MNSIRALLFTVGLFVTGESLSQIPPISIHSIDSLMMQEAKPIFILLSTEWCQYCHMQKVQIQKNNIIKQSTSSFYYVEFDAESRHIVNFNGITYAFKPSGKNIGIHELAHELNGGKKMTFPTWIVLSSDYQVLFSHQGVLLPREINKLVKHTVKTK